MSRWYAGKWRIRADMGNNLGNGVTRNTSAALSMEGSRIGVSVCRAMVLAFDGPKGARAR
jgi:hypothetical protein